MTTVCALTGVEDSSEHPALAEADGDSSVHVLQQDPDTSCPRCWGLAHGEVLTPVAHQHTTVVLRVQLRGGGSERSADLHIHIHFHYRKKCE